MISFPPLLVNAVAVRGFDQQIVRGGDRRRIRQYRAPVAPEVAAEEDGPPGDPHPRVRRAEEMARVDEVDLDPRRNGHGPVVTARLKL